MLLAPMLKQFLMRPALCDKIIFVMESMTVDMEDAIINFQDNEPCRMISDWADGSLLANRHISKSAYRATTRMK